ncbi:TELO2-interacting protein 2 [Bufo bufo]|uniref:TELO2-interacting protein 2 n=1 Tax=Bufo bufo TaxID=8384 RepID=UPI001ABEBEE1|nr:TELO2-interacting protein 2 [Bufo bufo]XP_040270794.1 TELO2-interacting protein 2 [Bufo bufo]
MAAAEQPLWRALSGLCVCLGRPPALPRTPAGCAELLQALVTWATPGPEPGAQKQVPARAAAALRASLLLLKAVSEASPGGHVTRAGSAKAEQVVKAENAEESGKLLLEGVCEGEGPKSTEEDRCDPILQGKGEEALLSLAELDVAPESSENKGAPNSKTAPDLEPVSSSGIIDPQCVLHCATAPLLLLCGAHIPDTPWSNAQSRCLANQLLRSLLEVSRCTSLAELLKGRQEQPFTTFREALGLLGPRLRKDTWESHPEARLVFSWMLLQVPRPWLSDFLSRVMPPSLLFSDDHKLENKVLGIHCLHHIIKNVPAAELRQYNRALVVYHALRNHLYITEAEILEVVLPCLRDLFPVLHKPPAAVGAYQKDAENPSDQVMQLVLTHMEMAHRIALRRLYARNLPALQDRLGVGIARHMKRLLRVIVGYLEVYDGPEETARLCILETLQGTIKYAWPRIPPRLPLLLKSLIKLIYELSSESNQNSGPVTEALLNGATECLLLLDNCSKGQVRTALQGIPSVCIEPLLLKCVTRVLENT